MSPGLLEQTLGILSFLVLPLALPLATGWIWAWRSRVHKGLPIAAGVAAGFLALVGAFMFSFAFESGSMDDSDYGWSWTYSLVVFQFVKIGIIVSVLASTATWVLCAWLLPAQEGETPA